MKKLIYLLVIFSLMGFLACDSSDAAASEATSPAATEVNEDEPAVAETAPQSTEASSEPVVTEPEVEDTMAFDITQYGLNPSIDSEEAFVSYMLEHTDEREDYLRLRWDRMQRDSRIRPGVNTAETQKGFLLTPREHFIREWNLARVYDHTACSIEDGQTIAGPHLVIRMTNTIDPKPDMRVLEIGTGSGYQAAVLSNITNYVYTIEIKENLFNITDQIYNDLEDEYPQYKNIVRKHADGYYGWEEYAPFDRILVTCGIDHIPPALLRQLAPGGIMIVPIGPMAGEQVILAITKNIDDEGNITLTRDDIYGGQVTQAFVPFVAADGTWHTQESN